jgi:lipid-binding SYLF domain-containing protein
MPALVFQLWRREQTASAQACRNRIRVLTPHKRRVRMKRRTMVMAATLAAGVPGTVFAVTKEESRADVRKAADQALAAVYKVQPSARKAVESAAGYAAFSNFGMKILVAGSGTGKGVAFNNKTKATTYMKMAEVQAGLGFGVKKFQLVWVFDAESALNGFVNSGWEIGGQATASAKTGDKGASYQGAVSIAPGVWLYQVSGDSLALELTAKGTKYYKDSDLN